jgi:hypothetical protein
MVSIFLAKQRRVQPVYMARNTMTQTPTLNKNLSEVQILDGTKAIIFN